MYSNLIRSLKSKGISMSAAAKVLEMPEATFRTKVQYRSFSVEEAFAVKQYLFPELDIRYLFSKNEHMKNCKDLQEA